MSSRGIIVVLLTCYLSPFLNFTKEQSHSLIIPDVFKQFVYVLAGEHDFCLLFCIFS